jgi:spore coat polysaccharide biosynthesis protein SpsF (cytidylyltransferase family)
MENIKTLAIIQARMDSTRLPNKVILKLGDKSVIEHIVERVSMADTIDEVVVVTSINRSNLELISLCVNKGIRVFVGSEDDVLDRYYQVAKLLNPEYIIRITGDCPMIDKDIIDGVYEYFISTKADYTTNANPPTFPDGLDTEIFTFNSLKTAWENAQLMSEREHVTPYISKNINQFKINNFANNVDYSSKRWTLDEKNDFDFIKLVYDHFYKGEHNFWFNDILEYIKQFPEVENLNTGIVRNEGYTKSLKKDQIIK